MENENDRYEGCASAVAAIVALLLLTFVLIGCATRRTATSERVEVPTIMRDTIATHDTILQAVWRTDTTIVRDSVFVAVKGDTIVKERYNTVYRIKTAHDTIVKAVDNVKIVERPVAITKTTTKTEVKEVNVLKWWQKSLMWCGVLALAFGLGALAKKLKNIHIIE